MLAFFYETKGSGSMGHEYDYFCRLNHLPDDVQSAIKKMPYERRKRMVILSELGARITMETVKEFNALKTESEIDRFARTLIFK